MTKKIIIPAPGAWNAFDTSLGIAQELLNRGDEVEFLLCSANKIYCPANPFLNKPVVGQITCSLCKFESSQKLSKLRNNDKLKIIPLEDGPKISYSIEKEYFDSDLQKMSFSNLQGRFAQKEITGTRKTIDMFVDIMLQNKSTLAIAKSLLAQTAKNDELIIFNGRLSGFFPFVDAAENLGRKYYCFEHPDSGTGAFVVANSVVHDPEKFADQVYKYYKSSPVNDSEIINYGRTWLDARRNGLSNDKNSAFMRGKTNQHIYFEKKLHNYDKVFSFFVSSEYELDFIADSVFLGYKSQIDFINDFLDNYLNDNEALIIRMHPNMVNVDHVFRDSFYDNVNKFQKKNVFLVKSDENISSLKCVELSDIVFGFGTTVSIEAALLGKPVISFCNTQWSRFLFDYTLAELKHFRKLLKEIERNFCKADKELRAARFIYTLHRSLGENQLVSNSKSHLFANHNINLWFRLMNYIHKKIINYQY